MTRLRELRIKKGLTLAQLEEKTGINRNYLSQIERGDRPLNARTLKIFCEFYQVKPNELLGYETMSVIDENDNEFSEQDIKTLRALKSLSDEDHLVLRQFIDFLIYQHAQRIMNYDNEKSKN